jgi:hypothetical protein
MKHSIKAKTIPGWEDYLVSENGMVVRKPITVILPDDLRKKIRSKPKLMKVYTSPYDVRFIVLYDPDPTVADKRMNLGKLVATLFVPNPDEKTEIEHIDGNKGNNHANNLRWI